VWIGAPALIGGGPPVLPLLPLLPARLSSVTQPSPVVAGTGAADVIGITAASPTRITRNVSDCPGGWEQVSPQPPPPAPGSRVGLPRLMGRLTSWRAAWCAACGTRRDQRGVAVRWSESAPVSSAADRRAAAQRWRPAPWRA